MVKRCVPLMFSGNEDVIKSIKRCVTLMLSGNDDASLCDEKTLLKGEQKPN